VYHRRNETTYSSDVMREAMLLAANTTAAEEAPGGPTACSRPDLTDPVLIECSDFCQLHRLGFGFFCSLVKAYRLVLDRVKSQGRASQ
jgi:hypothetical protein